MWTSLLRGPAADRARVAIADVARALRHPDPSWRVGPTLSNGDAGLAVFHAYLADHDRSAECIDRAIDAIGTVPMPASLHQGYVGVAWAAQHLLGRTFDTDDDPNAAIDDAVLDELHGAIADADAMNGVVGIGIYALERAPLATSTTILEAVVAKLAALAEYGSDGARWRTPAALLDADTIASHPDGAYNLGLAHGSPGVIVLLAACAAAGIAPTTTVPLLERAVQWLRAQQLPGGGYPDLAGETRPARLGWCYGDLSVATALVIAGKRAGRAEWLADGRALARRAAERDASTTGVRDACLCHGAAGLGHMFARLADGDPHLEAAAVRWYEAALALQTSDSPVGGFAPFVLDPTLALGDASVGMLTGAAGVALALHAAITAEEPAWDRALLLSLRD